jgi:ribonuclease HII
VGRRPAAGPRQPALFALPEAPCLVETRAWARGLAVAGVDEVGRGPLAGPVVAAAVVLDPGRPIEGLRDSKLLSAGQRERLAALVRARARGWAVGRAGPRAVERLNVLGATWVAMRAALERLPVAPGLVLVDGHLPIPGVEAPQRPVVAGDRRCASIAAASILAKVARDALMRRADRRWPGYGFGRHKGYATAEHAAALERLGPCPLHRRTFQGAGGPGAAAREAAARGGGPDVVTPRGPGPGAAPRDATGRGPRGRRAAGGGVEAAGRAGPGGTGAAGWPELPFR